MKKKLLFSLALLLCFTLFGCAEENEKIQIAATTLPVYEFTECLCNDTDISVHRLVTEDISCLHDYTLQTRQMRLVESAELIVISGAELETFLDDILTTPEKIVDASQNIELHCSGNEHSHDHSEVHHHSTDPHIWLSPVNAAIMAKSIYNALSEKYPQYSTVFDRNYKSLEKRINDVSAYAKSQLSDLSCRELITFHDGFHYMAEAFDLQILHTIEEESGSEASAQEIIALINTIQTHQLPAIFVEKNNPGSAASIISNEIGINLYALDMALSGDSYFTAMYHNIDTLKEALK